MGWNKSQMARELKISSQLYGQYERKNGKNPGADFFIAWKKRFKTDLTHEIEIIVSREVQANEDQPEYNRSENKEKGVMQALLTLVESNRDLASSNKSLANSHEELVLMLKDATGSDIPKRPTVYDSMFSRLLVLIAEVGSGKHWQSTQEALAALSKRFYDEKMVAGETGTPSD